MKRSLALVLGLAAGLPAAAQAQSQNLELPTMTVTGTSEPSLIVPTAPEAERRIQQTPGAVDLVPDTEWKDTGANTLKEILDYTPGVFAQPKWGEDTRLSIRGSGLSRNFHLRGVQLYQDGVPINSADGSGDFMELDPTAFRYVEVFKGANGLRYGTNTLGGAINFVTPTGYDADLIQGRVDGGSFDFNRQQISSGGNWNGLDGFVTASRVAQNGFRDHNAGHAYRATGNVGWKIADDLETRFYLAGADIYQQIPGSVSKYAALNDPTAAANSNISQNYQRNVESWRLSNKTSLKLGNTTLEAGAYAVDKQLIHPIFQYIDYRYHDFGAYARGTDEREIMGHGNRLTLGSIVSGGWVNNSQFTNSGGNKGALQSASSDRVLNLVVYGENGFDLRKDLTLVTGAQYMYTTRKRTDRFDNATDTSGEKEYSFVNPKVGLLWQVDKTWQVFTNLSHSTEAPTFSELNFTNAKLSDTSPQESTTFEIGTRGRRPDYTWDLTFYRAHLLNEFQFFDLGGGNYQVTNADKTVHQGIEAGVGWAFLKGIWKDGDHPDRLWLNAAYTYSDFHFDGDSTWRDNDLPGAPRHYLRAEVLYKADRGLYAGPTLEWVPQAYYVDNANTVTTKSYALLGFRAGYDITDKVSVYLDARNLTNERYIASASIAATATEGTALFEPGTGRSFYMGLNAKW